MRERRAPRRRRVEVLVPQRGDRKRLSDLAQKNAEVSFSTRRNAREDTEIMLAKLQKRLRLPKLPRVIECYDISHIQGFAPVASMVVFVDGRPERSRYRTYRVRAAENRPPGRRAGNDDFASMYEVLSRRLRRAREGDAGWELPDLIVIDGGKGQLGMALAAARDVGIDVRPGQGLPMVGLAKERDFGDDAAGQEAGQEGIGAPEAAAADGPPATETIAAPAAEAPPVTLSEVEAAAPVEALESADPGAAPVGAALPDQTATADTAPPAAEAPKRRGRKPKNLAKGSEPGESEGKRPDRIFLPHAKDAIPIRPSSAEMFVLQHLRDEAHRFAVTFHRRRRGNLTLRSALADVPGIGPGRQRALLRHFGSLKKIKDATLEELSAVPGMTSTAAAAVVAYLGAPTITAPTAPVADGTRDEAEEEVLESAFAELDGDVNEVGSDPE